MPATQAYQSMVAMDGFAKASFGLARSLFSHCMFKKYIWKGFALTRHIN